MFKHEKVGSWQEYKRMAELPLEQENKGKGEKATLHTNKNVKAPSDFQRLAAKYGEQIAHRIIQKIKDKERGPWRPAKKLSRDKMEEIRREKLENPEVKTQELAQEYKVNYAAVKRILRSKWRPSLSAESAAHREQADPRERRKHTQR